MAKQSGWETISVAADSDSGWESIAKQELPAGVKPSEAGGGRGSAPASAYVRPPEAKIETPPAAVEYTDAMGNVPGSAAVDAATPTPSGNLGLIARVGKFLKPESKSVLESYQPTPEETQAEIDKRLAVGAGPISQQTIATADLLRSTRGTANAFGSKDTTVNRVVQLLDEKKAPAEFADLIERANDPTNVRAARDAKAAEFRSVGEWAADTLSGLAQGGTSLVQLPTNIIAPGSKLGGILRDTQKELQSQESDALKAQREQLRERVENEDGFLGKYFATVESLVTSPALGLSEAIKQVPNFLGVMGLAKVGSTIASGAVGLAGKISPTIALGEAISGGAIQAGARAAGATAGGLAATTVMTSGDAAGNVYEKLIDPKQTPRSLWEKNPDYQKLIADGKTPSEAIDEIATAKARLAAVIVAPLGVLGFMGAEASLVARGAGKSLSEIATPKGAAKLFGKELIGEQLEEGGTQLGANVIGQTVNPEQKLFEGVPEAMATAAITSAPYSGVAVGQQVRDVLNRPAPAVNQAVDVVARRLLDVQSYDANIITPQQTAKMAQAGQGFGKATSAEEVVEAANLMAGSVDELLVPNTIVPPTAAAPTLPVMPEATAPTELPPIPGLPAMPEATAPTELPPIPGLPAAVAPAPLPAVNPETEKLFGLDKLRLNAPRPQSIQGEPVANLTDDKLTEIVNDESVHAMTRRGAAIELTARQAEQAPAAAPIEAASIAAPTPAVEAPPVAVKTMTPAELRQMRLGDRRTLAREFDQTENDDGSITFTPKLAAPSAVPAAAPETNFGLGAAQGRVSDAPVTGTGDTARADLQARLDEVAARENVAVPTLATPAKSDETAVAVIGKALGVTGPVVAYADPNGADGFELGGAIAINTKTQKGIAATSWHENFHISERIAEADTQAGRTDTPAQQYVASMYGLFDEMSPEGKRSYVENFLIKPALAGITDPTKREQLVQKTLSAPLLRSEMVADFMGNRANDREFLADLAKADPKGFGGFVQKWIGILDNMLVRLRGVKDKSNLESVKVDQYVKDLNQAKMVARDAMVAFRNGTLQQSAPATAPPAFSQQQGETNERINVTPGGEVAPGLAGTAGQIPALGGGGETPSYGTAREGAVSVVGRHYSTTPRQSLSGAYYGRGLKGAEATRLDASTDPRLKNRVYFYADQGAGIRPESGVGGHAHEVQLNNIYDPASRLIKPQADANAFESAVINAGFDGYMAPFGNNQSAVVLLGQKHKAVPMRAIGQPLAAAAPQAAAPTTLTKGLLSREANAIDVGNIPGAQVRMGNLQIPAGQTEAANVELARIGSDVRFSAKQKTVAEGRIRRSIEELVAAADSQSSWRTWYTRHEKTIVDTFGEDSNLFQKLLSATSQATGVKGNVTLALKAYDQLLSGRPFTGYLPAVIKNLDRIANDEKLAGAKISQYGQANEGDVDAIAVDRHIAMLFFNTKTPNPRQIASAKERIKIIAARLEWEPRQVQAALWAFNQVRLGTDPAKVESYDKILEARADTIAALRAYHGRGTGGGLQVGGAVGAGNQERQGPVPVTKTSTELELNGIKFSAKQRNLTSIPTITIRDLVGKRVMGIKADLTTAGVSYTGIDGSQLEFPIEMLGGPNFVRLPANTKTNVVWAVRGGATLKKIMAKVNESDYILVHAMNDNSHLTNATVSQAYVQTVEAYLRDKRITPDNLLALDKIVRSSENKNSLPEFPGFESPDILSYIDGLSFDQRGALAKMLETKQAQALGLPNLDRFRRETMDAEYAGYRQGDTMLVIEIDKKNPTVKLGEEGTKMHPSYPLGLRGRVVGKLAKGVNYELIFRDYFENKVPTLGNKEAGAWYAFDRVLPVQEITSEIADVLGKGDYKNITSSRQAQASLALANNQWLESGKTKVTGGISTIEFVDALRANEGAAALTLYDADEVKAGVKDGSFKIYQLGKEGGNKGLQIFFGLKKGTPWYADMIAGIGTNEVEVVSVTNNEPGASGVATPAIITKAIAEGATVLDAFAVKSKRFPDGFLPEMYGQFGFETIGTIPFDASYYDANKLSDLKAFWAKGGWKEADGYPDVVVMRWKGKDADRKSVIERYVRTGETGVSTGPDYFGAATGNPAEQRDTFRGAEGRAPGGDNGSAGRIQGADNAAPVVRRAYNSLQELASLSDGDIRNLGLNPEDVARLRNQLAPGATPDLESVFAGLDKRGMAKAKAETAFTSRPDGAQIKFVQDNFLDILAELDDSGLVKINCD